MRGVGRFTGALLALLLLAAGTACSELQAMMNSPEAGTPTPDASGGAATATPVPDVAAIEDAVFAEVNSIRVENGLAPLLIHEPLRQVARAYSCRMADEAFFSHVAPSGETLADRVQEAGISYRLVGENIAMLKHIDDPVAAAVDGWMESEGHRENILKTDYQYGAVGACIHDDTFYLTQNFLTERE
jgi:uncharacterized protein YkwD